MHFFEIYKIKSLYYFDSVRGDETVAWQLLCEEGRDDFLRRGVMARAIKSSQRFLPFRFLAMLFLKIMKYRLI